MQQPWQDSGSPSLLGQEERGLTATVNKDLLRRGTGYLCYPEKPLPTLSQAMPRACWFTRDMSIKPPFPNWSGQEPGHCIVGSHRALKHK